MEKYINPYTDLDWDIANGMEAAEIADITGLTPDEIAAIQPENK